MALTAEQKETMKNLKENQAAQMKEWAAKFRTIDEKAAKAELEKLNRTTLSKPIMTAFVRVYHNEDIEEFKVFFNSDKVRKGKQAGKIYKGYDSKKATDWFIKKYSLALNTSKELDLFDIEI